ncbi:MAG TPA: TonB family protein [Xanthomonadaceae bacterium]|nr:TonB family protein [Xanthomonadaceae bacterium]
MTSAEVLGVLVESTVALSAAIALVLMVRRPLRRGFGATVGYAAWAVAPVAVIGVLLPAMALPAIAAAEAGGAFARGAYLSPAASVGAGGHWLVVAWLCGATAMAIRLGSQQRAFVRSLGELRPRQDGTLQATAVAGLPAVVGLLRPRTVLPADFHARYTPEQQDLLRRHERGHVERGDLWANALVAAVRCLCWFNPLVHVAARAFRHDQELACDQRVLAAIPGSRRAYGEAMFNTQLAAQPLPLGCHWGFGHPLKERIAMLKQPLPSHRRWIAGAALVTALTSFAGLAAWAAQPPAASTPVEKVAPASADTATRMLHPPRYPAEAIAQGITGEVVLLIDIDAQGHPTAVAVERAEPAGVFEAEAAAAAWKWTFTPAVENGRPVASQVRVPVRFEADGDPPAPSGNAQSS